MSEILKRVEVTMVLEVGTYEEGKQERLAREWIDDLLGPEGRLTTPWFCADLHGSITVTDITVEARK